MYGADSYSLQARTVGTAPAPDWTDVSCIPSSTSCSVTVPMGTTQYSFRVMGKNSVTGTQSAWANAAIFLSEAINDGYVIKTGTNYSAKPNDTPPGIRAGEGSGMPLPHWRGILSFNTGALSSVATAVLGAKLRLHQATSGSNFSPANPCVVDVKKGSFGGNAGLAGTDYYQSDLYTTTVAFNIVNTPASVNNGWFEMVFPQSLATAYVGITASPNDHTQFRIYFQSPLAAGHNEGWDSGESTVSPPQLIVQYQ